MTQRYLPFLAALLFAAPAWGATECPLIRPPGLTAAEVDEAVDRAVMSLFGEALVAEAYNRKPKKTKDTPEETMNKRLLTPIGNSLGFAAAALRAAVAAQKRDMETLTPDDLKVFARKVYFAGKDGPAPPAVEGAEYRFNEFTVRTPQPAAGWVIKRCNQFTIEFERDDRAARTVSTATVAMSGFGEYKGPAKFLATVRENANTDLPAGLTRKVLSVTLVKGTKKLCADARYEGTLRDAPYREVERSCFTDTQTGGGYATSFSTSGAGVRNPASPAPPEEAMQFILGASPK